MFFSERSKEMQYQSENKPSSIRAIYESPNITVLKLKDDIITNSPATDPNEGEWDVEGK